MTLSKYKLRQQFRDIRSKISPKYREEAALGAANFFKQSKLFAQSECIACYLPFKDEFDSSPLIEFIWQGKKTCYLPVLAKDEKSLLFVLYEYGDALHFNPFSILEPVNITRQIAANSLDLVITPLVAFDSMGHRLGTGGGYYDRTFAFLNADQVQTPRMVGLAYAAQQAGAVPADPWDISLQEVITEKQIITMDLK